MSILIALETPDMLMGNLVFTWNGSGEFFFYLITTTTNFILCTFLRPVKMDSTTSFSLTTTPNLLVVT